ncbi:MAG: DUF4301 family protein, partial [Bacteroidales bacterium]|nr:DUF4301 family protein [Bacteroidales bacterium]
DLYAAYNQLKADAGAASAAGASASGAPLHKAAQTFFDRLPQFPFCAELKTTLQAQKGLDLDTAVRDKNYLPVLECLLETGMGYGKLPKALLLFHTYADGPVTAMEEHFAECAQYAACEGGQCYLHFTISEEHKELFLKKVAEVQPKCEKRYGVRYHVDYSVQKPSTDTVAVTTDNGIYRDEKGRIVFRPGGHGALIENLNDIDADLIFIKNIDNVCIGTKREATRMYKEAMANLLLTKREISFGILAQLAVALGEPSAAEGFSAASAIRHFSALEDMPWRAWLDLMREELHIRVSDEVLTWPLQVRARYLFALLNRPMRVCGMVRNEGAPGGGPFWVSRVRTFAMPEGSGAEVVEADDTLRLWPIESLQIVESSQVDHENAEQEAVFRASTHFNPVDLVCSVHDYAGRKFDLRQFVDPMTAFISRKSVKGTDIKAMELPGLWNGAMADWITLFVEEPIQVFTPVKTVNDLLRDGHRE